MKNKRSFRFKDKEKANILQKQFSFVFTKEPEGATLIIDKRTNSVLQDISITVDMVRLHLLKLNVNKSCGPDEIYPRMLLELADIIAGPVAFLLNMILASGTMPKDWKLAFVTPIYKKGSKHVAENYRPISLTSVLCKIMESLIREHVLKHLLKNRLLSNKQYGFINGRSTTTQLLYYLDQCVAKIAEGGVIDTIFLDFAKAFDTVPHHRLLGKLQAYGIQVNLFHWIKEFLKERTQIVMVNGMESEPTSILSGIPQGTVLGPLLFVVYINGILDNVESHGLLFADDTKIYRVITKKEDAKSLQDDLHELEKWSDKWLLKFHPDKCHVLTLGKFDNIKHTERYKIWNHELEHVFEEKDLGIIVDSELTFAEHISSKVKKASTIVGLIRRSFTYLDCICSSCICFSNNSW